MKDSELEDIIREANQPSRHTKEQFMNLCPGIFPLCDEELNWWEEWLDNHPDEKANSEIAYYEYCKNGNNPSPDKRFQRKNGIGKHA